jgi:hypothetical protein
MKLSFFGRRPTPADLPPVPVPSTPKPTTLPPTPAARAVLTPPPTPAAARPAPTFRAGRYTVTYDRFGRYGDRRYGIPAPMTLTLVADSVADLAEQVRRDIGPFVGTDDRIEVTVDMVVSGGKITAGSTTGTFTFARGGI